MRTTSAVLLVTTSLLLPGVGLAIAQGVERLVLPRSVAEQEPALRCHLVVDQDGIAVDGLRVLALETVLGVDGQGKRAVPADRMRGQMITPLYDVLLDKAEQEKALAESYATLGVLTQRDDLGFDGKLLVSVDAGTPFEVLRSVLYTAGQAQFGTFLFLTHNPWEDAERTIETSLPAIGVPGADDLDERPPLNLSLVVSDRGIDILGADQVLDPDGREVADEPAPAVPCDGDCETLDDYDWAELNRLLGLIKDEYPDDLRVIVVSETGVPFDVLVRVMDNARWAPYLPLEAEQGAWQYWKSVRRELFPRTVVAGGAM